jgi:hypothetical protein
VVNEIVRPVYQERIVWREVPKYIEQEILFEKITPIERVNIIEEIVEVPIEWIIEWRVDWIVEKIIETEVEKDVDEEDYEEQIVYIDKIVEVPVE